MTILGDTINATYKAFDERDLTMKSEKSQWGTGTIE
jgi:hypothetical protein